MIVIVGHGASAWSCPSIDNHTVVRLATAGCEKPGRRLPYPGTRVDVICSTLEKYRVPDIEFWHIKGELETLCRNTLKPFKPKNPKPSTGLCACIIARHKHPDEDIRVTGFDWTINPSLAENYRHDARAENECFLTLDIQEYG